MIVTAMAAAMSMAAPQQVGTVRIGSDEQQPAGLDAAAAKAAEEDAQEIAEDAARDLKDSRFYNKPGATRAEYDAAWQECRLIARGSRTPTSTVPYVYNPGVISPLAAGIGAGIGGLIGQAIVEGMQRRANRRSCLLVRGWRLVEVEGADRVRIAALSDAEREAHFNGIVGASDLTGMKVTSWENSFAAPRIAPESEQ